MNARLPTAANTPSHPVLSIPVPRPSFLLSLDPHPPPTGRRRRRRRRRLRLPRASGLDRPRPEHPVHTSLTPSLSKHNPTPPSPLPLPPQTPTQTKVKKRNRKKRTYQSCIANHSLHPPSAANISPSVTFLNGFKNGTVSSTPMSYAPFTSNHELLLAANKKFLLSCSCSGAIPSRQSSPKNPCSTAGKSNPVATRRRMYGCRETCGSGGDGAVPLPLPLPWPGGEGEVRG